MRFRSRSRVLSPSAWKKRSMLKFVSFIFMGIIISALTNVSRVNIVVLTHMSQEGKMTDQLLQSVQSRNAAVANSTLWNKDPAVKSVPEAFGHTLEGLQARPP